MACQAPLSLAGNGQLVASKVGGARPGAAAHFEGVAMGWCRPTPVNQGDAAVRVAVIDEPLLTRRIDLARRVPTPCRRGRGAAGVVLASGETAAALVAPAASAPAAAPATPVRDGPR
jgi:hypothetical protein